MNMKHLLIGLGVLVGFILVALLIIPRVAEPEIVSVFPEDGANFLAPQISVEIQFSYEMNWDSVIERINYTPRIDGEFSYEEKILRFTPIDAWPAGEEVVFHLSAGAVTKLNVELADDAYWSFRVWDTHLAYLWPTDQDPTLYFVKPGSEDAQKVIDEVGVLDFYVGDGSEIYYSLQNSLRGSDIWRLDFRSGEQNILIECGVDTCSGVQVSADNQKLAYEKNGLDGSLSVWVFYLDDLSEERISSVANIAHMPQWSSTGLLAYYDSSEFKYFIVDINTSQSQSFENFTGELGAWSPDGEIFVTVEYSPVSTTIEKEQELDGDEDFELETVYFTSSQLSAYEVNTGKMSNLSGNELVEDDDPVFSPDGQWLVFSRRLLSETTITPGRQLWLMRADGSHAQQITDDPEYKYMSFVWHPDSEQVVTVRASNVDHSEPTEIWIYDLRTDEAEKIVSGGFHPAWIE